MHSQTIAYLSSDTASSNANNRSNGRLRAQCQQLVARGSKVVQCVTKRDRVCQAVSDGRMRHPCRPITLTPYNRYLRMILESFENSVRSDCKQRIIFCVCSDKSALHRSNMPTISGRQRPIERFAVAVGKCSVEVDTLLLNPDHATSVLTKHQAATYGKCIVADYQSVHQDMCAKEFSRLKDCYLVQWPEHARVSAIKLTRANQKATKKP